MTQDEPSLIYGTLGTHHFLSP